MNSQYEIYQAAATLAAENKTPTVALLKAKLPKSIPLAHIIKGLQYWQSNPTPPEQKVKENEPKEFVDKNTAIYIKQQIQQAISPLKLQIEELQNKINQLK